MRNRLATLAVTALVLVGAAQARAGLGGLAGGCNCAPATGECQTNVAACDNQLKPTYKVVYDSVQEKRTKVCYETVKETVMKPVAKTCYRDECKTCYKTVHDTCYRTVQETVCKPCVQTVMKDVSYTVC